MNTITDTRDSKPRGNRASGKQIEVTFTLIRPGAQEVYLCGDFNQWSPASLRMVRHLENDQWEKRIVLKPGRYQYKFLVDGEWILDPKAFKNVRNRYGSMNSVVEVRK